MLDKAKIRQLIENTREALNFTQKEFGDLFGVTPLTVWRWEHEVSCPRGDMLYHMVMTLMLSSDELRNARGIKLDPKVIKKLASELKTKQK